jgi:hypothetical protein
MTYLQVIWGGALSKKIAELTVARERKEIVKAVEAIAKSRAGEGLDEYSQCKEYCEYLKEECKINILQARIMALGGNGEQSLQLAKDPVENRQKLLDRAKVCTVGGPLVELTEGDITQTKLEDHLIQSLHYRIQKLFGDDELLIKLDEDPVENRKKLLNLAELTKGDITQTKLEDYLIQSLHNRAQKLSGDYELLIKLDEDPDKNRKKLLKRFINTNEDSSLGELTKGDITQKALEDRLIKSLHHRIQELSRDHDYIMKLYQNTRKNRKALLKRAKKITRRSSLEEIVNVTPKKMGKLSWIRKLKPRKFELREDISRKFSSIYRINKMRTSVVHRPQDRGDKKDNKKMAG